MKNILLLYGGASYEHDVSCQSIINIVKEIDYEKYNYKIAYIDKQNEWYLVDNNYQKVLEIDNVISFIKQFDCIFNIIHGKDGEDGKLQALFSMQDIKYVGCDYISSMLCMNKDLTKLLLECNGVPVVPYAESKKIKFPVIVKPTVGGSSIGISKANTESELLIAIKTAKKYNKDIIIENFITSRELECSVIEKDNEIYASTIGEIISGNEFYDYDAKYNQPSKTVIPAVLDDKVIKKIKKYSIQAFKALKCNGMARIDFFFDEKHNKIYLNEINTLPGFTNISMYTKLLNYDGISTKEIIDILIENALKK